MSVPSAPPPSNKPVKPADETRSFERLRKRIEFQRVRGGPKFGTKGFLLQGYRRGSEDKPCGTEARLGFIITRKLGGAVARNRIRRRLREALRTTSGLAIEPGCDYVLIGRRAALDMTFADLQSDLIKAFRRVSPELKKPR